MENLAQNKNLGLKFGEIINWILERNIYDIVAIMKKCYRNLILSYGGAMRHGIIPNLLDGGYGARYNARDAVWFWLYAIVKYIEMVPEGVEILKSKVLRIFIHDDTIYGHDLTVSKLVD